MSLHIVDNLDHVSPSTAVGFPATATLDPRANALRKRSALNATNALLGNVQVDRASPAPVCVGQCVGRFHPN